MHVYQLLGIMGNMLCRFVTQTANWLGPVAKLPSICLSGGSASFNRLPTVWTVMDGTWEKHWRKRWQNWPMRISGGCRSVKSFSTRSSSRKTLQAESQNPREAATSTEKLPKVMSGMGCCWTFMQKDPTRCFCNELNAVSRTTQQESTGLGEGEMS